MGATFHVLSSRIAAVAEENLGMTAINLHLPLRAASRNCCRRAEIRARSWR